MKAPQGAFLRPFQCKQCSGLAVTELPTSATVCLVFFTPEIIVLTIAKRVAAPVKHVDISILVRSIKSQLDLVLPLS